MCHVPTPLTISQKKAQLIYLPITEREGGLDIARARILGERYRGKNNNKRDMGKNPDQVRRKCHKPGPWFNSLSSPIMAVVSPWTSWGVASAR